MSANRHVFGIDSERQSLSAPEEHLQAPEPWLHVLPSLRFIVWMTCMRLSVAENIFSMLPAQDCRFLGASLLTVCLVLAVQIDSDNEYKSR